MYRFWILAIVSAMFFVSACSKQQSSQVPTAPVAENSPAPMISVATMDGSTLALSSLKGKVVLLNFWATWCPPCREEIPSMMKLNERMAGKPFQMVCVSIDDGGKAAVEEFFKSSGFHLPAYLDLNGAGAKTYGLTGVPESYIINKKGILVKKVIGGLDWNSPEVVSFIESLMQQ